MNRKLIVLGIIPVLCLTACGNSGRVSQANAFKTSIASGNYESALSYTVLSDYDYLAPEKFNEVLKATGWIDFLSTSGSFKKAKYNKDIMVEELTTENDKKITVQLTEDGKFDMADWYVEDVSFLVPSSSEFFIDGIEIDKSFVESSIDGLDTYELPAVFNTSLSLKTINPVLGEATQTVVPSDATIDMTLLNSDVVTGLVDTLEAKINLLYGAVVNKYTAQELMAELPCIASEEQAETVLTAMKSNQRIEDPYIGYTSVYAEVSLIEEPKFIDEDTIKLSLKLSVSFNMGTKPCTQIINQDIFLDSNGEIAEDTDLSFLYGLVYTDTEEN